MTMKIERSRQIIFGRHVQLYTNVQEKHWETNCATNMQQCSDFDLAICVILDKDIYLNMLAKLDKTLPLTTFN